MTSRRAPTTWPKPMPQLTDEQMRIRDDHMKRFHEAISSTYGAIARFNHAYPLPSVRLGVRTLEIGAGLGEHLEFEDATEHEFVALELRQEMADVIAAKYPQAQTCVGDVEQGLAFEDSSFDRVIAIHVLEHLPNLPIALDEVRRVLKPAGVFEIVIPCEGGLAYTLGRKVTAQRAFERRYGVPYGWCIASEHLSVPREIIHELDARFERGRRRFWPLRIPTVHMNICIGLSYRRPA